MEFREPITVELKKQLLPFCCALLTVVAWSACLPVLAINPASWTTSLSTSGNDVFWTSPTNVDPDFNLYNWSYTITRVDVGWRWGILSNTYNALNDLGDNVTDSGSTAGLPAVILDEIFELEGSGATVHLEIDSQGYGQASIIDVNLGTISVDAGFFGTITANIESIDFTADATVTGIPGPTDFQWTTTSSGNWHDSANWTPAGIPNGDDNTVEFTGVGPSVTTVLMDSPATVREITLDGSSSYRLNGNNTLTLDANTGAAGLTVTGGNHSWTAPVSADASTTLDIASGAELTLGGSFDFANQTVIKSGSGRLYLDSGSTTQKGTFQHNDGHLGGDGIVNGDLILAAAAVAPGHDVGQLTVGGDFTMGSDSALEIEIGGTSTSQFDTLQVGQNAYLDGTLAVTLTDNYYPDFGQQFSILQASSVANYGVTLGGPDADKFKLVFNSGQLLLESTALPIPTDFQWVASSGSWHNPASWSPAGVPNGNNNTAEFAGAGPAVTTVTMDSPVTVREITLDGSSSYRLEGGQTLTLDADTGTARVTVTGGNHSWTAPVFADTSTTLDIASGAELTLKGRFDFANQTVTKLGSGHLYLDSGLSTQTGTFQHNDGHLGGDGIVNGDLTLAAAVVAPGHGVGELTVKGDFTMGSESVLEIEIGGTSTNQFDTLQVAQNVYLDGTLAVTLTGDYYPDFGQQFSVVQAVSISNRGIVLGGPDAEKFKLIFASGELLLESTVAGLPGDYNNDGLVDAADYTVWRDHLGTTTLPNRDPGAAGPVGQSDYLVWKTNFGTSGTGSATAVPEPGSLFLILLVALVGIPVGCFDRR